MNELNKKCVQVINTYYDDNRNMYCYELLQEEKTKCKINQKEIDQILNYDLIKEYLNNVDENYSVLLYQIMFENDITEKLKEQIIYALLDNIKNNSFNPILHILMMNTELNNEIISRIIEITDEKYVYHCIGTGELGKKPFDYRYHIIKRKEISDELKQIILERYDFCYDYDSVDEERQIYYDLRYEFDSKQIKCKEDISKYKDLEDECRAYKLLKKYKKTKNKIKANKK